MGKDKRPIYPNADRCTAKGGHYIDNQGYCHCCGIPMNADWIALYTGDYEAARKEMEEVWGKLSP